MSKEAMKLALEALALKFSEGWHEGIKIDASDIMLLNHAAQALEKQPAQQEPVAWKWEKKKTGKSGVYLENPDQFFDLSVASIYEWTPLYTSPPAQRTWVGLTDEDRVELWKKNSSIDSFVNATEAKLKEKNT